MYERHREQGFEILGIAFVEGDAKGRQWLEDYLARRGIDWPNAPAGIAWYGEPFEEYDVRYLPFNLLLDPDGNVIDTDVRGFALDEAIGRLFAPGD